MKILLVDDGEIKLARLKKHLTEDLDLNVDSLLHANTAFQARAILRETRVDLLILDIMLPRRETDKPSADTALELLADISIDAEYKRPKFIVGLTQYKEIQEKIEPQFEQSLWTVIHFDVTTDEWLFRLNNIIKYLTPATNKNPPSYGIDLCVITVLPVELDAVLSLPWNWSLPRPIDDSTFVQEGFFESAGTKMSVATSIAPRMGMVATAIIVNNIIHKLNPRFVAMTGICAGIDGRANLGDIIVANPGWNYQSGKHFTEDSKPEFAISPHQLDLPEFIASRATVLGRNSAELAKIQSSWPVKVDTALKLLIGPVASGSAVIANPELVDQIKLQKRELLGIDMEIYGMYAAVSAASRPKPVALAFKSVCDFADAKKNDNYQAYAAYTSAQALKIFFETYMAEIREHTGI